ncbi:ATP-binding protein [Herbidospora mongoliensis]|uniref:ATP-binding protein n=1 Tax=Herbidospora mongoliensis TaxID=688067 RepID=UPI0008313433|nr:BTAD domain-containing putative transcriptional regulator [Herbidospora mongoliensis]
MDSSAPPVRAGSEGLRLQILGPLRIWRDGVELDAGPRQQAYLLALLLAQAGRPISTGELIDLIWGDDAPSSALNVIQKYVGALRRALEPALLLREAGSFLQRHGGSYLFTATPGTLDLVAFRELVDAAEAALARRSREAALDHYVAALGLWRGPAGNGVAEGTTAMAVFAAVDDEFYTTCVAAADLAISLRQAKRVLPALRQAASVALFHEPVQTALIGALDATGRHAEALSVFHTVRDRLADELGVEPGPALKDMHRKVLTQPSTPAPIRATTPSALIGRAKELGVLRDVVERALAGSTAIGVVEGEPGAGKTRLLEEAAAVAVRHGALVVWGSCLQGDGTPAMWPWEQALGAVVDSLPAPEREKWRAGELGGLLETRDDDTRAVPDDTARFRLFEQVVAVVGQASARRPALLILDDLQWADAASLQLFSHLAGRLPGGAAMIGALRDRAPAVDSGLSRVLASAGRLPGHRRFRLGPLDPAAVAQLIRRETGHDPGDGVARTIHARTAGNPFFVRELSRLLGAGGVLGDAGVPSTVRDVVRDRMAGLDDRARDLLHVAALIGRDVELRLLSRAAGVDVADCLERLEPLQALGLLETHPEDPFSLRFAHDLVRESVSETTARQRAVRLHLRVADALEQTHADDESVAERLAYHLWAAGPLSEPVRTAAALVRAGHRAASKLAFEAAGRHLQSAARIARTAGLMELELSALTLLAIVARRQAGFGGSTFDLLERAEYLARALGRDAEAADFLFIRLIGAYTTIDEDRGRLARRMLEHGQASPDPTVRVYSRQAWGLHQWDIGNIGAAFRSFTAVDGGPSVSAREETPLRRDGGIPGEGPGWQAVTTALHGDVDTALAFVDTWDDPGDSYAVSVWAYYTTMIASMAGDAALARRAGERWVAAGLDRLNAQIDHYIRLNWCWARALTGDDPAGAAAEAELLLADHLLDPPRWGIAHHYGLIADMWLAAGRPERAAAALDRGDRALGAYGQRYAEGLLLLHRARLLQAAGEPVAVVRASAEKAHARSAEREAHLFARRAERFLAGL